MAAILPLRSAVEKLQAAVGSGDKAGGVGGDGGGAGSGSEQQVPKGKGHLTPLHGDFLQVIVGVDEGGSRKEKVARLIRNWPEDQAPHCVGLPQ